MTSIKVLWSLAVHRHQKQRSMSCIFGQSGCRKAMVKNEKFQYKFKKKNFDFLQKKNFGKFSIFFQRGDPLKSKLSKKIFLFLKNFKHKPQKCLSWDHSNINRNKVMNFGDRSSYPAETARLFMVIWAIMPPPCPE